MSEVVTLQIGESRFQVSPATFNQLKPGVFTIIEGDTYYADRDGDIFKYILKYLRHKTISFPNDFNDSELLMEEAEFYGVSDLQEHFESGAGKPERVSLKIMIPEEKHHDYGKPGIDILLNWATSHVDWETLVEGFKDRLNSFTICKCNEHEIFGFNIAQVSFGGETTFGEEIRCHNKDFYSQFAFHVNNGNVPSTFINGFLTSGFTLVKDKSSTNVTVFEKDYKSVRELVYQRMKPVI
ncbi:BTB/POZ domain-containing protein KCTD6-like isoform X2 [Apostichopus japonicus]|uniref:BTB/POZ domain-containing protein KCTD6-like isoform X2 n=1 Tax=Stichopus japonicus TaxID=307972 RepID=UPI003AB28ED2